MMSLSLVITNKNELFCLFPGMPPRDLINTNPIYDTSFRLYYYSQFEVMMDVEVAEIHEESEVHLLNLDDDSDDEYEYESIDDDDSDDQSDHPRVYDSMEESDDDETDEEVPPPMTQEELDEWLDRVLDGVPDGDADVTYIPSDNEHEIIDLTQDDD